MTAKKSPPAADRPATPRWKDPRTVGDFPIVAGQRTGALDRRRPRPILPRVHLVDRELGVLTVAGGAGLAERGGADESVRCRSAIVVAAEACSRRRLHRREVVAQSGSRQPVRRRDFLHHIGARQVASLAIAPVAREAN